MKKFNHGGRFTSAFLLLTLMVFMIGCVGVGTAEPINANQEGQDPYDWSNYPGEVILDAPEFIQGDDHDGAAEPGEMADSIETEQPSDLRIFPASSRKVAITFRCFLIITQPEKRETSLLLRTSKRLENRKTTSLLKAERIPPHSLLI